jgi:hypothetical protein
VDGLMLCGTDDWDMYAFDFGIGGGDWLLHRYDSINTAYSPSGLTTWQYVEAICSTSDEITMCNIKNYYDHSVSDVILKIDFDAYWYDSQGNLLESNSDFYTIDSLSSLSSMTVIISKNPLNNEPPDEPIIEGEINGKVGRSYKYRFTSIDPDGDDILEYIINWGDGSGEQTIIGPFKSGSPVSANHIWSQQGTYFITAKAKDIHGLVGPVGTFEVNVPRLRAYYNYPLALFYRFSNMLQILRWIF